MLRARLFQGGLITAATVVILSGCQAIGGFKDFEEGSGVGSGGGGSGAGGRPQSGGGNGNPVGGGSGTGKNVGDSCATDDDCGDIQKSCVYGTCRTYCRDDGAECGDAVLCESEPSGQYGGCWLDRPCSATCADGQACGVDQKCRPACGMDSDCHLGTQVCIKGACVSQLEAAYTGGWDCASKVADGSGSGYFCDGNGTAVLEACNVGAPGVVQVATCGDGDLCSQGAAAKTGKCPDATCQPGDVTCTGGGGKLFGCNDLGTGLDKVLATCASEFLCGKALDAASQAGHAPTQDDCPMPECGVGDLPTAECDQANANVCTADKVFMRQTCGTDEDPTNEKQCNPTTGECFQLFVDATEVTRKQYRDWVASHSTTAAGTCTADAQCMTADPTHPKCDVPTGHCIAPVQESIDGCDAERANPTPPPGCTLDVPDPTALAGIDAAAFHEEDLPMGCVDWCDAALYCADHGQHLCGKIDPANKGGVVPQSDITDAGQSEWTNACTSGGQFAYAWGSVNDAAHQQQCLYASSPPPAGYGSAPVPVTVGGNGTFPNKCHSTVETYKQYLNMAGNVAEWEDNCDGNGDCVLRGGSYKSTGTSQISCAAKDIEKKVGTPKPDWGFRCCGPAPSSGGGSGGSAGAGGSG